MESLGGEVPFFISTYSPELELTVDKYINSLKNKLTNAGITVHVMELYDLACAVLSDRRIFDRLIETEIKLKKSQFFKQLASLLEPEKYIRPVIAAEVESTNAKILFLKGIGSVFPFIRAELLLNNLQASIKNIPVIMFFPGQYQENKLYLFRGEHTPGIKEPYYRAFNLNEYKV